MKQDRKKFVNEKRKRIHSAANQLIQEAGVKNQDTGVEGEEQKAAFTSKHSGQWACMKPMQLNNKAQHKQQHKNQDRDT